MGNVIRINLLKSDGVASVRDMHATLPEAAGLGATLAASPHCNFQGSIHPVLVVNSKGRICDANDAALLLLDHEIESLAGVLVSDVIRRLDEFILDLLCKVVPLGRPVVLDTLCARHDGSWFACEVTVNYMKLESRRIMMKQQPWLRPSWPGPSGLKWRELLPARLPTISIIC